MLTELPSAGLLEGFTIFPRGKKSYLSLTYDLSQKHEPTHFALAATVIDSFLAKCSAVSSKSFKSFIQIGFENLRL